MSLTNRAKASTATTGTGTVTLGSAVVPYQTWATSGAVTGRFYDYLIEDGTSWEIGLGLYNAGTGTLTRPGPGVDPNFESSSGALLNLSGSATVACVANKNSNNWQLIEDFTISSAIANRTVDVSAYDEVMAVCYNVVTSVSGFRGIRVSTDGGATYRSTSGDYVVMSPSGVPSNDTIVTFHTTSATAARGGVVELLGIRGNNAPKVMKSTNTTFNPSGLFLQSNNPITNIQYINSTGGNFTSGRLITYGR